MHLEFRQGINWLAHLVNKANSEMIPYFSKMNWGYISPQECKRNNTCSPSNEIYVENKDTTSKAWLQLGNPKNKRMIIAIGGGVLV